MTIRARSSFPSRVLTSLVAFGAISLAAGRAHAAPGDTGEPAPAGAADAPPVASPAANGPTGVATPPAAPATAQATQPDLGYTREDAESAEFNGGRYILEVLVSGVGGGLASYGTFKAMCGDKPCLGGALAAGGVDLLATPLLTMGTGALLGGRGGFGMTALVGLAGFTATAPLANDNPGLALGISLGLMPFLCPLGYEISSNMRANEMKASLHVSQLTPLIVPLHQGNRTVGAMAMVQGTVF